MRTKILSCNEHQNIYPKINNSNKKSTKIFNGLYNIEQRLVLVDIKIHIFQHKSHVFQNASRRKIVAFYIDSLSRGEKK